MRNVPLFQVDAFAAEPFRGNPAAVCLLREAANEDWMQKVASELRLPATAFVRLGGEPMPLRWFTPATELQLCGHATLAATHVLWEEAIVEPGTPIAFETRSGSLTGRSARAGIELDFPAEHALPIPHDATLLDALRLSAVRNMARNRLDVLLELESEAAVRSLRPDMAALARVETRGVIITAAADGSEYDFVSRFFAPAVGVAEDAATGSAHCCLGPYWAERLGRTDLRAYQASPRGAHLEVAVRDDRVMLTGQATTVARGSLLV